MAAAAHAAAKASLGDLARHALNAARYMGKRVLRELWSEARFMALDRDSAKECLLRAATD